MMKVLLSPIYLLMMGYLSDEKFCLECGFYCDRVVMSYDLASMRNMI
jgi:hypothetical protein